MRYPWVDMSPKRGAIDRMLDLMPMHKVHCNGWIDDPLMYRWFYLYHEGREFLHNSIRHDHGLPNRF